MKLLLKITRISSLQILFVGILGVFILSSCSGTEAENKTEETLSVQESKTPVKVMKLHKETIDRNLPYTANLKAFEEVNFGPASPGHVKKIYVEVGDHVSKGDLIAMMDNTQLETAKIQLDNAEFNYRRLDTLYQLNSISEQQYESAKNGYELALANVNFMKENTKLTSPINGVITGKYFEGGEFYSGAPNTSAGKAAIVTIMQINLLKAVIDVAENYYSDVKKGMKAKVTSDIYKNKVLEAKVYKVSPTIDESSRSFEVELLIQNENEILRPGMFSRVSLNIGKVETMVVPSISVLKEDGTNTRFLYVIDNNGKAKRINVEIINRYDDQIEISSDKLKEGDIIVIAGQDKLDDGMEVKIIK